MTAFSRRERAALCDLLDEVGPDAPTLCAGWTTYDLAAHLVLREGSPLAVVGMAAPPLEGLADRGMAGLKDRVAFPALVERVRRGPPLLSPFRVPVADRAGNAVEYYVHHEDVRRSRPDGTPRSLTRPDQDTLWRRLLVGGRLLARRSRVGVRLERTDVPASHRAKGGEATLVVRGLPSELVLFAYGRGDVADVETDGDAAALAGFRHRHFGL